MPSNDAIENTPPSPEISNTPTEAQGTDENTTESTKSNHPLKLASALKTELATLNSLLNCYALLKNPWKTWRTNNMLPKNQHPVWNSCVGYSLPNSRE